MTNNIELMNIARRICHNTKRENLVIVGMDVFGCTLEEALLKYFFCEVNPTTEKENVYTITFDYFYNVKVDIPKDRFYHYNNKLYILTCDYNTYRRNAK